MNIEKLQKMAGSVRTGGKGSVRRHVACCHCSRPAGRRRPSAGGSRSRARRVEARRR